MSPVKSISAQRSRSNFHLFVPRLRSFCIANAPILVAAVVFCALILVVNRGLFSTSLIEAGDQATNTIQVQNAAHFRELLGNYSRWHFHHPGPFRCQFLRGTGVGVHVREKARL